MITDDIIRNKFHEILSSKDKIWDLIIYIKRYEFFRENFVKECKALIEDPNTNISSVYNMAYCTVDKIARFPDTAIVKAICQGDYDLVDSMLTAII
ncbi:hypothetical protein FLA4_06930 [Candidatus Rickettsia kotlanii]|nr:hypothetical protein FLA4_06930 [Candidatus Rickettsia kotlanii]BDU61526.1 hypothetical protein HM2_06940 [Candidatus Rickettsia kotlanii]